MTLAILEMYFYNVLYINREKGKRVTAYTKLLPLFVYIRHCFTISYK